LDASSIQADPEGTPSDRLGDQTDDQAATDEHRTESGTPTVWERSASSACPPMLWPAGRHPPLHRCLERTLPAVCVGQRP
jgi:hypothetical protein